MAVCDIYFFFFLLLFFLKKKTKKKNGIGVRWRRAADVHAAEAIFILSNEFMASCRFYDDTEPDVCIVSVVINTRIIYTRTQ